MKISTKGRYALRMMIDLAQHKNEGYLALKDIAERQGISKKYLEQIVPVLNRMELLHANRGFQGGYKLARKPEEYTIGEILRATEGSLAPISCLDCGHPECERTDHCITLPFWRGLHQAIEDYVNSVTLQDLVEQHVPYAENGHLI